MCQDLQKLWPPFRLKSLPNKISRSKLKAAALESGRRFFAWTSLPALTSTPPSRIGPSMIIAIDGTLASGKGTIARRLASWYGLPHMDTGRLYRATGVAALHKQVDFSDAAALAGIARCLDLNDYSEGELRTGEAGQAASKVAAIPEVRAALLELQRALAHQPKGAVLDGRDIGTVICPEAEVKLYVTASDDIRAQRRFEELTGKGHEVTFDEVLRDLQAFFHRLVPPSDDPSMGYLHHTAEGPDDMPAHIKAAMMPVSLSIPVTQGRMALGTWQGIYLFEHRARPHHRRVAAHLSAE